MRKKKPRPGTARVVKLTAFRRILRETPPEVKMQVKRMLSTRGKWYGIRRRILRGQYQPVYINRPKRKGCGNIKYLLERKLYGNGVTYIGG